MPFPASHSVRSAHLQALHHAWRHLMLQPAILPFRVLPDHYNVDVLVTRLKALEVVAVGQMGEQIQFLAKLDSKGADPACDWRANSTLDAHPGRRINTDGLS